MHKRLWLNLILLALVVVLTSLAVLEPGKEEPKPIFLGEVDENAIDRITLKSKDTLIFEKREGRWWLTGPFAAPANEIRVRQLMDIVKSESDAQYPLKQEELAKYELDKPVAELTVGAVRLLFGGVEPIDMRRYVRVGDADTLHLVTDDFSHHLNAPATDFVEKKLLPDETQPNEIFLPGIKASKGQDGKWTVEPPSDVTEGITDLVSAWTQVRAIDVKRLEQPPQGDIIRIGYGDRGPIEFVILQREPDLILARADWGLKYQITAEAAKGLLTLRKPAVESGQVDRNAHQSQQGNPDEGADEEIEDMEGLEPGEGGTDTEGEDVEGQE